MISGSNNLTYSSYVVRATSWSMLNRACSSSHSPAGKRRGIRHDSRSFRRARALLAHTTHCFLSSGSLREYLGTRFVRTVSAERSLVEGSDKMTDRITIEEPVEDRERGTRSDREKGACTKEATSQNKDTVTTTRGQNPAPYTPAGPLDTHPS